MGNKALAIAVIVLLVLDVVTGIAATHSPSSGSVQTFTQLGVWKNMPSAVTELMGNTSYRGILKTGSSVGESGIFVGLSVGCITPSNTVGAMLQLQYANYSDTTHTNSSNFANIGGVVFIDNSANWPCPGNLEGQQIVLPSLPGNPTLFIFRVMGSVGGGQGDNPRFSSVNVYLLQSARNTPTVIVTGITTAHFLYQISTDYSLATTTTENLEWIATNATGAVVNEIQHGTSSCSIPSGNSVCPTTTVTFATVFIGTPDVVATTKNASGAVTIPIGAISLLLAQTLTV